MESTIIFQHFDEDFSIAFESQGVTTDEVLEHFVKFMLAMGYTSESIYEAMRELLEEHEDYLKSCAEIKAESLLSLD
jgi:DNA-binding transcriptional regulator YhcF (GntR family)